MVRQNSRSYDSIKETCKVTKESFWGENSAYIIISMKAKAMYNKF